MNVVFCPKVTGKGEGKVKKHDQTKELMHSNDYIKGSQAMKRGGGGGEGTLAPSFGGTLMNVKDILRVERRQKKP